jgi:hypothetical protein
MFTVGAEISDSSTMEILGLKPGDISCEWSEILAFENVNQI